MRELEGRVAIVTGASRNIGRAIACALASAGAAVVVNARSSGAQADAVAAEIAATGERAFAMLADVGDPVAVAALVDETVRRYGRLDVLVCNAAVRHEAPFAELGLADWHAALRVVLDGAFLCAQAALPQLRASDAASIVTIGGLTARTGAPRRAHVVAAKAGLEGLTRALAHDLGPDGITVNCVAPGLIETVRDGPPPAHRAQRATALGTRGAPEDVARAVRWLAGPAARFVTGQTLHVDGGASMG
jgi:3-oxoacyl-[acyl-carrier protein] reductase